MKRILIILLFIYPLLVSAQTDSLQTVIDNYVLDGQTITYSKVYEMSGMRSSQIKELAINRFSSNPQLSILQATISSDQIEGSFTDLNINYRKYGYKASQVSMFVYGSASASFTIQFKDNKYRVVVKGVKTKIPNSFSYDFNSDFVTSDGKLRAADKDYGRRGYYVFGKTMDELFDIRKESNNQEW